MRSFISFVLLLSATYLLQLNGSRENLIEPLNTEKQQEFDKSDQKTLVNSHEKDEDQGM